MSYHSTMKWTNEEELTEEVIDEIAHGLEYHLEYYGGDKYNGGPYMIMSTIDNYIYNIGWLLDKSNGDKVGNKKVNEMCQNDDRRIAVVTGVLTKMDRLEQNERNAK